MKYHNYGYSSELIHKMIISDDPDTHNLGCDILFSESYQYFKSIIAISYCYHNGLLYGFSVPYSNKLVNFLDSFDHVYKVYDNIYEFTSHGCVYEILKTDFLLRKLFLKLSEPDYFRFKNDCSNWADLKVKERFEELTTLYETIKHRQ